MWKTQNKFKYCQDICMDCASLFIVHIVVKDEILLIVLACEKQLSFLWASFNNNHY